MLNSFRSEQQDLRVYKKQKNDGKISVSNLHSACRSSSSCQWYVISAAEHQNVPCAVCSATTRVAAVMIPAKA